MGPNLKIDSRRLFGRIRRLGDVGALEGGGVCRSLRAKQF